MEKYKEALKNICNEKCGMCYKDEDFVPCAEILLFESLINKYVGLKERFERERKGEG